MDTATSPGAPAWSTRRLARRAALLSAALASVLAFTGCTSIRPPEAPAKATAVAVARPTPGQVTTVAATAPGSTGTATSTPRVLIDSRTPPPSGRLDAATLDAALAPVRTRHPGDLSVAWAPVGRPDLVQVVGSTRDVEAWSTIKVPISLAVSQAADGQPSPSTSKRMRLSLTHSDNAASAALWRSLGDPDARVEAVLAATGDPTTRPGRSAAGKAIAFGLTPWQPDDSARFAAMLPCARHADPVLTLMGYVIPDHSWGLGTIADARFKGGWGPSPHGYLARQIGVVPRADGRAVAVALATQPKTGGHEEATATLTDATRILVSLLSAEDGGVCSSS